MYPDRQSAEAAGAQHRAAKAAVDLLEEARATTRWTMWLAFATFAMAVATFALVIVTAVD